MQRIVRFYRKTGCVRKAHVGTHLDRTFGQEECKALIHAIRDCSGDMLEEIRTKLTASTGLDPDLSTICRAVRELGFTLSSWASLASGSVPSADAFYAQVMSPYHTKQLFFLDETAKDGRSLRRSFGYALRGESPVAQNGNAATHRNSHDALRRKRSRVVLILTEVQGGIHPRTLAAYRRWAQRARGGGAGTDRTKYGTTRRSTQQHFKHHTQMLSKTAVVENAKAMCRALTKIKAKLHAADAAPMGAGMRA